MSVTTFAGTRAGILGISSVYATARSTSTGSDDDNAIGQTTQFRILRSFLSFDTSSIPDDATITSAELHVVAGANYSATDFNVQCYQFAWAAPLLTYREANYDGAYGASATLEGTLRNTADGWVDGTEYSMAVNVAGINLTGTSNYTLVSSLDVAGTAPSGSQHVIVTSVHLEIVYTSPVSDTQDLLWDSAQIASDTQALLWDAIQHAFDTQALLYDILVGASDSQTLLWNSNQITSDTQGLLWNTIQHSGDGQALLYDILMNASDSQGLLWDIFLVTYDSQALLWNMYGVVSDTQALLWNSNQVTSDTQGLLWNLLNCQYDTQTLLWANGGWVADTQKFLWDVHRVSDATLSLGYSGFDVRLIDV